MLVAKIAVPLYLSNHDPTSLTAPGLTRSHLGTEEGHLEQ